MTEEQQETIVNEALRKFCQYLNGWWNEDRPGGSPINPYTPEKFTITDPDRGLYGETNWSVLKDIDEDLAFPEGLIHIVTSDGDEGGGNTLWVGLQGHFSANKTSISWIAHTFDLSTYMIYTEDEGYRTPPNGEMKK